MDQEKVCCPRFNPENWDDKLIEWNNKLFIEDNVKTFLFMPLNFGQVMTRMDKIVSAADGKFLDNLCLSDHVSKWNMRLLLAVDKQITNAKNVTISGRFYSKVY